MSAFNDLVLSLNPVLYLPLLTGTLMKHDTYGGSCTVVSTPTWGRGNKGYGLYPNGTGMFRVADSGARPELRLTTGTLWVAGQRFRYATAAEVSQRLIAKRDAGGVMWEFHITDVNVALTDSVGASTLAANPAGTKSLAVTFANGSNPEFFYDGVSVGVGTIASTISTNDADLNIGNFYTGIRPAKTPIECAIAFPTTLTPAQMLELYQLWEQQALVKRIAPLKASRLVADPPPSVDPKCTEVYPGRLDGTGAIVGQKGVGSDGGMTNSFGMYSGGPVLSEALVGYNAGNTQATYANPTNLFSAEEGAIELIAIPRLATPAAVEILASSDGNTNTLLQQSTTGRWQFVKGNPAVTLQTGAGAAHPDHHVHLVGTWWKDGAIYNMQFFVDGESIGSTTFTDATVVSYFNTLSRLGVSAFDGKQYLVRTYDEQIRVNEARRLYLQYATTALQLAPRQTHPVSLANIAAAGYLGPWLYGAGTWNYQDDGNERQLANVAAGWASVPSKQAYGGWYLKAQKGVGALQVLLIGSMHGAVTDAAQNGYVLFLSSTGRVQLYRMDGGAYTSLLTTGVDYVAQGVEYEFLVTRDSASLFYVWIRGGAYTVWTAVGTTAADATYTTSEFYVADLDAVDLIAQVVFFPLGGTLDPTAGDLDGVIP